MAGCIKRLTPKEVVNEAIEGNIRSAKQVFYDVFIRVGEECINYARLHGGYIDQTGNLRSSIGYAVIDNGKVIKSKGFKRVKKGNEGMAEGQEFLNKMITSYGNGLTLIVVAGMKYAGCVEARGYDVISGAELKAEQLVPQILKQLGFNVR